MRPSQRHLIICVVAAIAVSNSTTPVLARGGAPSIMDSPGYQRRLQESRQQLAEPNVQASPPPSHRHKRQHH